MQNTSTQTSRVQETLTTLGMFDAMRRALREATPGSDEHFNMLWPTVLNAVLIVATEQTAEALDAIVGVSLN